MAYRSLCIVYGALLTYESGTPLQFAGTRKGQEVACREVGGWGRDPFSRNLMSSTPRRKWYLTTGRRAH